MTGIRNALAYAALVLAALIITAAAAHTTDPPLVRKLMQLGFERYDARQIAAMSTADRRMEILGMRVCGPEGAVDFDPDAKHPCGYPHCNRNGWGGTHYPEGDAR